MLAETGPATAGISEDPAHFYAAGTLSDAVSVVGLEDYGEYASLHSLVVAPAHRGKGPADRSAVVVSGLANL